jgi:predicted PurR-regulated permease PerM
MVPNSQEISQVTLTVLFIGGMLLITFWILQPFLPALLWAATLVLATWPMMLRIQHYAGNRRYVAVVVMTTAILLVFIAPLWLAIGTVATNIDVIRDMGSKVFTMQLPSLPDWFSRIPMFGQSLADAWEKYRLFSLKDLAPLLVPYAGSLTQWIAAAAGSVGATFVQFFLTTLIAAVMYAYGEVAAAKALAFGRRMAGERGEMAVLQAGQAVRGVALGVVVTALAQSILGGIGLLVVGLPFAGVLTALMFILCLIQLGPGFVLVPAVIWLYYSNEFVWGTVLLLFTIIATTVDQFVRPILIRKGADIPLLLILAGVVGGLIAFGLLGIFIGPTVLAVAYTLFNSWIGENAKRPPAKAAADGAGQKKAALRKA